MGKFFPGANVTELTASRQKFVWPGEFVWSDIKVAVSLPGQTLRTSAVRLSVSGIESFMQEEPLIKVSLQGTKVIFPPGEAKGLTAELRAEFEHRTLTQLEGTVKSDSVKWDRLEMRQVELRISKGFGEYLFQDLKAQAYGGTLFGSGRFIPDGLKYSLLIEAAGIDTARMSAINDQIAAQLTGRVSGRLRVSGQGKELVSLESEWGMLEGAKVNAALLSALAQYIPTSQEKKRLEELIKKGGRLPVEVLSFNVSSKTPRHLAGELRLKSREVNLELNLTNDINTDGTLISLLEYWQHYIK